MFARIRYILGVLLGAGLMLGGAVQAQPVTDAQYGPRLEGFEYPWAVRNFRFNSQHQTLEMAYMDVQPTHPNGQVVVLLHGKNFCAATWEDTALYLQGRGYRVVIPDQIGFCKSDKPANYQFSFQQLARNTHDLLASLGISQAIMLGHSTGGMLAVRYGLMYPAATARLVLVDPIGLEDWQAKGVPAQSVDTWYAHELKTSAASLRAYEQKVYYAGQWRPEYDKWVRMLAGMYRGPGREAVAWNSARLYDMIFTQPVVYELSNLTMPTVVMVGDKDITAIGRDVAPPSVQAQLGHYPVLAHQAVAALKQGTLIEFPELGHSPQLQDPAAFHAALQRVLAP